MHTNLCPNDKMHNQNRCIPIHVTRKRRVLMMLASPEGGRQNEG